MHIEYYSNGCGTGKTYQIKQLIQQNSNQDFLVIVPSTALAGEYQDVGTVITGDVSNDNQSGNVQARITAANVTEHGTRVLVITQKAFIDATEKFALCRNRIVIQDEELKVFTMSKWKMNNHREWLAMFDIKAVGPGWFQANLNTSIAKAFIAAEDSFDDLTQVNDLLASPYDVWANNNNFDEHTRMFKVLKPEAFKGAIKVIIACANFEQTFQYAIWQNLYSVGFECQSPFIPYSGKNTVLHYAEQKVNSITYNKSNGDIRSKVVSYIKSNSANAKVVAVDNNSNQMPSEWIRLNHNCHGINEHKDAMHIAILSAINFDNVGKAFLTDICGMRDIAIRNALLGETAHQIAMRGVLRTDNDAECHIYLMEQDLAFYMNLYLFNSAADLRGIADTDRPEQAMKKPAVTQVDRNKANYIRKTFPMTAELTTVELMEMFWWKSINSRGKLLAGVLDSEKEQARWPESSMTYERVMRNMKWDVEEIMAKRKA